MCFSKKLRETHIYVRFDASSFSACVRTRNLDYRVASIRLRRCEARLYDTQMRNEGIGYPMTGANHTHMSEMNDCVQGRFRTHNDLASGYRAYCAPHVHTTCVKPRQTRVRTIA